VRRIKKLKSDDLALKGPGPCVEGNLGDDFCLGFPWVLALLQSTVTVEACELLRGLAALGAELHALLRNIFQWCVEGWTWCGCAMGHRSKCGGFWCGPLQSLRTVAFCCPEADGKPC